MYKCFFTFLGAYKAFSEMIRIIFTFAVPWFTTMVSPIILPWNGKEYLLIKFRNSLLQKWANSTCKCNRILIC